MRELNDAAASHHIELAGEYDLARKPELAAAFAPITPGTLVTIDMRAVSYVDSSFLTELVAMRLRLQERSVTLIGAQPSVVRVMQLAKLDRFFTFQRG